MASFASACVSFNNMIKAGTNRIDILSVKDIVYDELVLPATNLTNIVHLFAEINKGIHKKLRGQKKAEKLSKDLINFYPNKSLFRLVLC